MATNFVRPFLVNNTLLEGSPKGTGKRKISYLQTRRLCGEILISEMHRKFTNDYSGTICNTMFLCRELFLNRFCLMN